MWDPAYRAAEVSGVFCWNDIDMKVVRRITGVSGFLGKSDMSFFQTPENQISCTV